jgi:hypothetical protein
MLTHRTVLRKLNSSVLIYDGNANKKTDAPIEPLKHTGNDMYH